MESPFWGHRICRLLKVISSVLGFAAVSYPEKHFNGKILQESLAPRWLFNVFCRSWSSHRVLRLHHRNPGKTYFEEKRVPLFCACNKTYFKAELAVNGGNSLRPRLSPGFFKSWTLEFGEYTAALSLSSPFSLLLLKINFLLAKKILKLPWIQ